MRLKIGKNEFSIEDKFAHKLDLMCERVTKKSPRLDACMENAGYEGSGKTNGSIIEAAYIQQKTGRPVSLFFKTSSCLKFAQMTREQIIILDEPAFETLSTDAMTAVSRDFLRLITTMREKRHFLIVNFAKFWKFPDWFVIDRPLAMVYFYLRKGQKFRFNYIRHKKLPLLWREHQKTKKAIYGKLKSFGGSFPYVMEKIWKDLDIRIEDKEHTDFSDYMEIRDKTIQHIGEAKVTNKREQIAMQKLKELRGRISVLPTKINISSNELAHYLGTEITRLSEWKQEARLSGLDC